MLLPHHLENAGLNRLHLDTMQRHNVSKERLCELFNFIDGIWPYIKRQTLTNAIKRIQRSNNVTEPEAVCIVQLYGVVKRKSKIMLN